MNLTAWIVFALGMWAIGIVVVYGCAAMLKEADETQSDLLARARQARFSAPRPRRRAS